MRADHGFSEREIEIASEAVKAAPGGVDKDVLIDELYLGACAASLEARFLPESIQWTVEYQDALLQIRAQGMPFHEVMELAAGTMLRARWLDRYFHGVCPHEPDPRNANLTHMASLEELAMSAVIDVEFVVQAWLETKPEERQELLERLAETSRSENLQTRSED
jgi:hypothetical protein